MTERKLPYKLRPVYSELQRWGELGVQQRGGEVLHLIKCWRCLYLSQVRLSNLRLLELKHNITAFATDGRCRLTQSRDHIAGTAYLPAAWSLQMVPKDLVSPKK